MARETDEITGEIVDSAFKLHTGLGPGLLESVYERVLAKELLKRGLFVKRQMPVSFEFDGMQFANAFVVDLLVENEVVVELKSLETLAPVYGKQVLTYLRLLQLPVGLLINFGAATLKEGLHRIVNQYIPPSSSSASPRLRVKRPSRPALTIVELLVAIAIVGIVLTMLLPAVQQGREAARKLVCRQHLQQIGLALHNYHDRSRCLPYGWDTHGSLWTAHLLPFLEQEPLYDTLVFHEQGAGNWGTTGSPNETACGTFLEVYRCPTMPVPRHLTDDGIPGRVPAGYRGNSGNESSSDDTGTIPVRGSKSLEMLHQNGVFFGCRSIRFAEVQDGLSNTLFVGESQTDPDFTRDNNAMDYWSIGSPQIDPCQCDGGNAGTEFSEAVGSAFARLNLRQLEPDANGQLIELAFGSYHAAGAFFTMGDGSVRFLADAIDLQVYRALASRNGGEVVAQ